jgi:hypothetical protein
MGNFTPELMRMSELELPPDPVTGPRELPCKNKHAAELSVRRWHPSGKRWRWVCRECDRERSRTYQPAPEVRERMRISSRESYRKGARGLSKLSGSAPSWKPGLGHCEFQGAPIGFIKKPDPSAGSESQRLIDRYCAGCPVQMSCRAWAQEQPMFVGIAGGMMFGKTDKEEESAA